MDPEELKQYEQMAAVVEEVMIQAGVPHPVAKIMLFTLFVLTLGGGAAAETATTQLHRLVQGGINPSAVMLYKATLKDAACHCSGGWHVPPALQLVDLNLGEVYGQDVLYCSTGNTSAVVNKTKKPRSVERGKHLAWLVTNQPKPIAIHRESMNYATDERMCSVSLKFSPTLGR